jgi:hypothetical protein
VGTRRACEARPPHYTPIAVARDGNLRRPRFMNLEFQSGAANRAWRWMLAVDCAIIPLLFVYKLFFHVPQIEYMHLLATYHFGFTKRALVGTVVSWFADRVPIWSVYAIGVTAWIATAILFVVAFRKIFGLTAKNFPLFVFLAGSPFFLKNFMISIGYFDIYGCALALVALLVPVGRLYVPALAGGCICLILIHPIHFLLYVPTISFIAGVRYGLLPGLSTRKVIYGLAVALMLAIVFVAAAFFGRMPVPPETFLGYVSARASDAIDPQTAHIWYMTIGQEIAATWSIMGQNSARFPIYAGLIALHIPVARYFKSMIGALATPFLRGISVAALAAITIGYLVIFAVVFDYSRWVSNWAVCMLLAMHAIRLLPATATETDTPIRPDKNANLVLAWIVTVIPRVGITKPF